MSATNWKVKSVNLVITAELKIKTIQGWYACYLVNIHCTKMIAMKWRNFIKNSQDHSAQLLTVEMKRVDRSKQNSRGPHVYFN